MNIADADPALKVTKGHPKHEIVFSVWRPVGSTTHLPVISQKITQEMPSARGEIIFLYFDNYLIYRA
jgi:hypothetical protein